MMGFVIFIHSLVCLFLMIAILMQSGRGGGLTAEFAGAESMFGAKTNVFMVRTTTVLATIFMITCLTLAYFSARKNQSLIPDTIAKSAPVSSTSPSLPPESSTAPASPSPISTNAAQ